MAFDFRFVRAFWPRLFPDEVQIFLPDRDCAGVFNRPAGHHALKRGDVFYPVRLGERPEPGMIGSSRHWSALTDRGARVH